MELVHHRTGSGSPLALLHGIGSRWQMWEPVLEELSRHHEVWAVDLPGFGASPMPPPGTPPGAESLARLVSEFLASAGVQRPHVAGNSLGGLVALELARRGDVASAAGLSPAGFANAAETALARGSLRAGVRAARWLARANPEFVTRPRGRQLAFGQFVADPARVSAADAVDSLRALAQAPWFDATLPSIGPMAFSGGERISVPVTIAWGEHDRLLLPRQAQRAAAALPAARMVTLRGCGHVPTYDDPPQVARVILEAAARGDSAV